MQYSVTLVDNPAVLKAAGGNNEGIGLHHDAKKVHPGLQGLHRGDRSNLCVSMILPENLIAVPDGDYKMSLYLGDGAAVAHSEAGVYALSPEGNIVGLVPNEKRDNVISAPSENAHVITDVIKDIYDKYPRFAGWGIFDLEFTKDGYSITGVRVPNGGFIIKNGEPTKFAVNIIPWELKNKDEKIATLERPYSYISDEVREIIDTVAESDLPLKDAAAEVGRKYSDYQASLARKDKAQERVVKHKATHKDKTEKSVATSTGAQTFLQNMMKD